MPFCSKGGEDPLTLSPHGSSPTVSVFEFCASRMSGLSDSCCEATRGIGGSVGGFDAMGEGLFASGWLSGGEGRGGSEGKKARSW